MGRGLRAWASQQLLRPGHCGDPDIYRQLGSPPRAFFDRDEARGALSRLEKHLPQVNAGRSPLSASTSTGLYELHVMHGPDLPPAFPRTRPTYD